jgi:hypothetical protein
VSENLLVCAECGDEITKDEVGGYDSSGKPICLDCCDDVNDTELDYEAAKYG